MAMAPSKRFSRGRGTHNVYAILHYGNKSDQSFELGKTTIGNEPS